MEMTWMHPPGDLITKEAVPPYEVVMRLAQGWLHADPPPPAAPPAADPLQAAAAKALRRKNK